MLCSANSFLKNRCMVFVPHVFFTIATTFSKTDADYKDKFF